jgi:preprotein translocase subunit Sec61beta
MRKKAIDDLLLVVVVLSWITIAVLVVMLVADIFWPPIL